MARPTLQNIVTFLTGLFAKADAFSAQAKEEIDAAIAKAKAEIEKARLEADAISPGSGDALAARLNLALDSLQAKADELKSGADAMAQDLRVQASPEQFVRLALSEATSALLSGQSLVRHKPTDLAG
jgi:hypothetical protein